MGQGSITAIYTVLVEGDDLQDPIADLARASLDGHVVLSRQNAIQAYTLRLRRKSVSRLNAKQQSQNRMSTRGFLESFSLRDRNAKQRSQFLLGAYRQGSDKLIDSAIAHRDAMMRFLRQPLDEASNFESDLFALKNFVRASMPLTVHQAATRPRKA